MRAVRTSIALTLALGLVPALASAQVTPLTLLTQYEPVYKGFDYDLPVSVVQSKDPAIKAAIDACKVDASSKGYILKDGQGRTLRKFLCTSDKKTQRANDSAPRTHLTQWSYYQDGFEVYREVDSDDDGSLDEVRWMNSAGTRVAKVRPVEVKPGEKKSRIVSWVRISPEEASKVLVQALVSGETSLLETVLATPEELTALGAPEATIKRVTESKANRTQAIGTLRNGLIGWKASTTWSRFDGAMPHVISPDAGLSLKDEILVYENAVIFAAPPEGAKPEVAAAMAYLSAADVVKIGDTWKFLDLPHAIDPAKPVPSAIVSLRSELLGPLGPTDNPPHIEALGALAKFDTAGPPANADKKAIAEWNVERVKLLHQVIATTDDPAEKLTYNKQAVGNLGDAWKTGLYPDGATILDKYIKQGGKIGSYADYRKILAQFDLDADEAGANFEKLQKAYLTKFEAFLTAHPQADEIPDVLLSLATINDFNDSVPEATAWYERLAKDYSATEAGKKAKGAIRRLAIEGKNLKLAGQGVDGKPVDLENYRGKVVLVVYFRTDSETDQKELRELVALQQKLGNKGFDVLAVSLDDDKKSLDAFLKGASLPWSIIFEQGGGDSRPAQEMGIISTTTMLLVDAKGQVVNRKIRKAAEVEKALDKAVANRGTGAGLGMK